MNYDSYKEWAICACNGIIEDCNRMTSGNYMHNINAVKMTAKMIRDNCLPHLFETPQSPWISVKERLPEPEKEVIILNGRKQIDIDHLTDDGEGGYYWWKSDDIIWCDDDEITHWMPIPELPKEDGV